MVLLGILRTNETPAAPDCNESSGPQILETTYEKCTPLYRRIERAEWGEILSFLDTGYWPNDFFIDPVSPEVQAKTWVYRFNDTDDSTASTTANSDDDGAGVVKKKKKKRRLRWSQLPLHLSLVMRAPFLVIKRLVEVYPESVRCTDDQKMLPLHLASTFIL